MSNNYDINDDFYIMEELINETVEKLQYPGPVIIGKFKEKERNIAEALCAKENKFCIYTIDDKDYIYNPFTKESELIVDTFVQRELDMINDIIVNAIIHGADGGGSYESNKEGLMEAMRLYLSYKKLEEKFVVKEQDVTVQDTKTGSVEVWPAIQFVKIEKKDKEKKKDK